MKKALQLIKATFKSINEHKVLRLSAALAYYTLFSIGPLLFILILLAGVIFGQEAVRQQIHQQLQGSMGDAASSTIESMIQAPKIGSSLVTTVIGIFTLIFGASGVFGQLQDALNTIWEVEAKPNLGIWAFIRNRFLSLSMILGLGFLLLVSMVLSTLAQALANGVSSRLPIPKPLLAGFGLSFDFIIIAIFFALIFKFLPDIKVAWKPVWVGALFTAALFLIGKYLLSLYLGRQATTSSYGAAGSVAAILLWIYYATLIVLAGAEFTRAYALQKGHKVEPDKYAVSLTEEARAKQGIPKDKPEK